MTRAKNTAGNGYGRINTLDMPADFPTKDKKFLAGAKFSVLWSYNIDITIHYSLTKSGLML